MRGVNCLLHLSVKLLQTLNEAEDLHDCCQVYPNFIEEVQCNKGEGAQVAYTLVCGQDFFQAYSCGGPQGICGIWLTIQMLCQEVGV